MAFENGWYFLLLLPVAAAAVATVVLRRRLRRGEPAARFPSLDLASAVPTSPRAIASRWVWLFRAAALVLLVFALARPRTGIETVYDTTRGVDIALCVDVSGSMLDAMYLSRRQGARAPGEARSKLEAAKAVAADFIDRRTDDRIALVPFAKYAYRLCPLTLHHGWVKRQLARVRIRDPRRRSRGAPGRVTSGSFGRGTRRGRESGEDEDYGLIDGTKTAVGTAISVATNALRSSDAKGKVVILLTDGQSNFGDLSPLDAAEIAKKLDVRIYTIGAGASLADVRRAGLFFRTYNPIDEKTLREIAKRTGGRFFRARDEASLARIYEEIDSLEKTEIESPRHTRYSEHFARLAAPAMALVWLELAGAWTLFRRSP